MTRWRQAPATPAPAPIRTAIDLRSPSRYSIDRGRDHRGFRLGLYTKDAGETQVIYVDVESIRELEQALADLRSLAGLDRD